MVASPFVFETNLISGIEIVIFPEVFRNSYHFVNSGSSRPGARLWAFTHRLEWNRMHVTALAFLYDVLVQVMFISI